MATGYTYRIKDFYLQQAPNDTNIVINGWLAGAVTGEPVLTSAGTVDYTLVQTGKSFLPGSDYYDFLTGVIATALATKYDSSFTATGTDGSNLLTGITSTSSVVAGMALTGVGIAAGTTVLSIPSSTNLLLSANQHRTYTGILVAPTIVLSATLTSGSATVTVPSTTFLSSGMTVTGAGLQVGATVLSITNSTTFVLTNTASSSGTSTLTFSPNTAALQVIGVSPTDLTNSYVGLSVSGTQLPNNDTVVAVGSSSSFTLSASASAAGSPGTFTFNGPATYQVSTSNWVINYSEITTLVTQVNFGSL